MKTKTAKKTARQESKNDLKMWEIDGVRLFGRGYRQVLSLTAEWLRKNSLSRSWGKPKWIATVNPEFIMAADRDPKFRSILKKTDLNVMDGIGLVWARELDLRFMKYDLRIRNGGFRGLIKIKIGLEVGIEILRGKYQDEVVPGSRLMDDLCRLAAEREGRVFFLGGWGNRAERTAAYFERKYPGLKTAWSEGYPTIEHDVAIAEINKFRPDVLLVAYGMKNQEEWIDAYRSRLTAGMVIGVGRSFDYYSGELRMAPPGWRKVGLEWLYSLIQEPGRWRRQLALPRFVWKIIFFDM